MNVGIIIGLLLLIFYLVYIGLQGYFERREGVKL